jgi:hypothetical protein
MLPEEDGGGTGSENISPTPVRNQSILTSNFFSSVFNISIETFFPSSQPTSINLGTPNCREKAAIFKFNPSLI